MKTESLNYYLPAELVAQQPPAVRSDSRLLVLERTSGKITDSRFGKIGDFLRQGDCLVLNDTKVIPARFFARRSSGGNLEGLFLTEMAGGIWEVLLKDARKIKNGEIISIKDKTDTDFCTAEMLEKTKEGTGKLNINTEGNAEAILEKIGFPPLPPYIKRNKDLKQAAIDKQRYQTVYANKAGAIAAPTAGLHFTNELIGELKKKQVNFAYITLHVGTGTFKPITAETLEAHKMHEEQFSIDEKNARIINDTKERGCRLIAVGTTSVRTLETVAVNSQVKAGNGATELFIKPGYKFRIVDGLVTNFHLPKSTLLALVAAFAGLEKTIAAYKHAVEQQYRFYSYGDAMLIV